MLRMHIIHYTNVKNKVPIGVCVAPYHVGAEKIVLEGEELKARLAMAGGEHDMPELVKAVDISKFSNYGYVSLSKIREFPDGTLANQFERYVRWAS